MDTQRAVAGLLERAERDPKLASFTASVREWVPVIGAILAPGEEVRPGELPHREIAELLDRIGQHWLQAKAEASAQPAGPPR